MHDVDRTQLEVPQSEVVQDEILKKIFGRVSSWLGRQPSTTPAMAATGGPYRGSRLDPLRRQIEAARAELATLLREQAGAGSVGHLWEPMIREQRQLIARLEAELRRLSGGS